MIFLLLESFTSLESFVNNFVNLHILSPGQETMLSVAENLTLCFMVSKVLRTVPQGSASEEYKQEAFYPARGALFAVAIHMYSAVFSVRTELLRSNEIDLKKHKEQERR